MWSLWLVLALLLLHALAVPYQLYLASIQQDKPTVVFRYRTWYQLLPLLLVGWAAAWLAYGTVHVMAQLATIVDKALLSVPVLLLSAPIAIIMRLHSTYWRHDQAAVLSIRPSKQDAEYCCNGQYLRFALADVECITTYESLSSSTRGALWSSYTYQVWVLKNGSELVLTNLLYDMLNPDELVTSARRETVRPFICWLPKPG